MQRMPARLLVALIFSGLLVVGGALLIFATPQASASFGWFAYQPLSDSVFIPGGFTVLTQPVIGLGGVVGFALGRRSRELE